jgi:hypothetical protein
MSRTPAPYSRSINAASVGYWDRGTRVMVFAGAHAWRWSSWWLDCSNIHNTLFARHRYSTVLDPRYIDCADVLDWPVFARRVVIVDTQGNAPALMPLISAVQRDGCTGGEVFDLANWLERRCLYPEQVEQKLQSLQPWQRADFDGEAVEAYNARVQALFDLGGAPYFSSYKDTPPPITRKFERRPTREEMIVANAAWVAERGQLALKLLRKIAGAEFAREVAARAFMLSRQQGERA